jgi:quercetin dioxygenase-like cupin family protein
VCVLPDYDMVVVLRWIRGNAVDGVLKRLIEAAGSSAPPPQQPAPAPVTRTDLLQRALPPGDFRNVQAAVIELAPGAQAPRHRHDVAVLAYVLEGTVENRFDGGAARTHRAGESWWEAPGTVHDLARNASGTARARLLVVYIGETGKAATVPLR